MFTSPSLSNSYGVYITERLIRESRHIRRVLVRLSVVFSDAIVKRRNTPGHCLL